MVNHISSTEKYTIIGGDIKKSDGGPTKTIKDFKRALQSEVFSIGSSMQQNDPDTVPGVIPVAGLPLPVAQQFGYCTRKSSYQAEQACKNSSLIICHGFYRYHNLWINHIHKHYKTPYWFVPHGVLDPWVMQSSKFVKKAFWKGGGNSFIERASTIIFSTKAELDKARSQFKLPNYEVIPWPVELVEFNSRAKRREQIRKKLGIPQDAKVLLYFGRLHKMKQPLKTIRAFAAVGDEKMHLLIVGNEYGVTLKECYHTARELGVHKRVHLVGSVFGEKKYDYLFASDAYISLSHRENFNHTAAESMSAGLPLILSPGNDLQPEIQSSNCSWGLPDDRLKTAVEAIESFNSLSFEELEKMGARGRDWVDQNLRFNQFAERLQKVAKKYARIP